MTTATTTPTACPAWCEVDHADDQAGQPTFHDRIVFERGASDVRVSVYVADTGEVGQPYVDAALRGTDEWTTGDVRDFAGALLSAAAEADALASLDRNPPAPGGGAAVGSTWEKSPTCPTWCQRHDDDHSADGVLVGRIHYTDDTRGNLFSIGQGEDIAAGATHGQLDEHPDVDLNVQSFWGAATCRKAAAELLRIANMMEADGHLD